MIHHSAAPSNPASRSGPVLRVVIALFAVIVIAGCGSTNSKYDKTTNWSAEQLYADAKAEMSSGGWKEARERLTAIESRYPFGVYAQQALLELAYVNWKDGENEQALACLLYTSPSPRDS